MGLAVAVPLLMLPSWPRHLILDSSNPLDILLVNTLVSGGRNTVKANECFDD